MNSSLPSGTVTFLFSDIEGSTRLWEKYPVMMQEALARHDQVMRLAIEANHGRVVKTTGDGFHAAFETAHDGLFAAFSAQQALCGDPWTEIQPDVLRIRMALFTGEAQTRAGDYYGPALNRAARLMAIGHGGQVLLPSATADLVRERLPAGASLRDLGEHRLRDLVRPEHVFQLVHPSLPADFRPLNSLDNVPNNLPVQLTSFIGRKRELAEVKRLLAGPQASSRLVTLIGPGGTGKTRLALQVAADLLVPGDADAPFPHGAWLVEFATQVDADLVVQAVADVFSLREAPGSPPLVEMIINFLRAKQLLLILDNCEHLIEACARLADTLLRACPNIKILASSREAFGINGETIYRVPSLSLPKNIQAQGALPLRFSTPRLGQQFQSSEPGMVPSTGALHSPLDELLEYEAVQLFVERAAAAQPRFVLTEGNAPAVTRICQRLDGIPLALELAASRIQVFTPEQIAARLDDRFRLLTGGSRTALHRQQTLRALIDWSYDMLSAAEQGLFRALSVFSGGWSFEAAEAVYDDPDILNLLASLVSKSLVIVNDQGSEARYSFLETIRQYARDKLLEMGEAVQARDRLLDYCLQFTQDVNRQLAGPDSVEWLRRIDQETDNIRSAIEWGIEMRPVGSLKLLGNLYLFFSIWGNLRESQRLSFEALSKAGEQPEPDLVQAKARALASLGLITVTLGEMNAALPILEEAIRLARQQNDPPTLCFALVDLASALNYLNRPEEAARAAKESLMISRQPGFTLELAMSLIMLAWAEGKLGNDQWRRELLLELRAMIDRVDSLTMMDVQLLMGVEARTYGDLENARMLLERCYTQIPLIRSRSFEAMVRSELAHITRQTGNYQAAREAYCQTLRLWMDIGHQGAIANQLECLAFIARSAGAVSQAARMLGAAETQRERMQIPMTDYERKEYEQELSKLHQALPAPAFSSEWSAGRQMTLEAAVAYAIES